MKSLLGDKEPPRLFVPVILGTARQGRQSEHVAHFVLEEVKKRADLETELIDIRTLPLKLDDAGEGMKDPDFSATIDRADGLILVVPEYNHGYPGLLKHALDMNLKEYIHKAVGICGVSAGPYGGARVIENLLPVLRELGLVTTFTDVNFGSVRKIFDEDGRLLDQNYVRRLDEFLKELIWMARLLRHGREKYPVETRLHSLGWPDQSRLGKSRWNCGKRTLKRLLRDRQDRGAKMSTRSPPPSHCDIGRVEFPLRFRIRARRRRIESLLASGYPPRWSGLPARSGLPKYRGAKSSDGGTLRGRPE